jgi:hypothetical protein
MDEPQLPEVPAQPVAGRPGGLVAWAINHPNLMWVALLVLATPYFILCFGVTVAMASALIVGCPACGGG